MAAGFDLARPAIVASAGVSMYLTREANLAAFEQVAAFAGGSTFVTTFLLPGELTAPELRPAYEGAAAGARANGTPFLSFFAPEDILELASTAGFGEARHVSAAELSTRYFSGRSDGLRTVNGEELLVATT